jgi:hypothetical protein
MDVAQWQIYDQLREIDITLHKINAGIAQLVERLPCKQQGAGAIPASGSICKLPHDPEALDPYCRCQDPSCPYLHDYVSMTDIASDIDPEIMNNVPGGCVR